MRHPTLSTYLAKRFFVAILAVFVMCSVLIFMIDFIEMLRQSGKRGEVSLDRVVMLTLLRLPAYAELLIIFAVLAGTMWTLLQLNRKSELAVMRAGGMSVWQFIAPGAIVALGFGVFGVTVYNPLAAAARSQSEMLFARYYGREANFLIQSNRPTWLRQESVDGSSVIHGAAVSNGGETLTTVTVVKFGRTGSFAERLSAERADLREGYWELTNAWVSRPSDAPQRFERYHLATHLSPERVQDAVGSLIAQSIWDLPRLIDLAGDAGLPTAPYEVQFHFLLSRPMLLIAMVLLGATVSLRSFRSGGVQTMVLLGLGAGFAMFLAVEVSRQLGASGLVAPWVVAWVPVGVASLLASTVLLHQEDG
ncbi:MAG: LPS export ABC transporter permease LptG [Hyphomicrobiaceae bacterium]